MNLNKKIGLLLDNGLSPNFISSLTESKINFLFEKMSKRKEAKEQAASPNVQKVNIPATTDYKVPAGGEVDINNVKITNQGGIATVTPMESEIKEDDTLNVVNDPDATADGMGMFETDLTEKFESKAQQGLFWARCNNVKVRIVSGVKWQKSFQRVHQRNNIKKCQKKNILKRL